MDERLKEALEMSSYMVSLGRQKQYIKEQFETDLVYYQHGGAFSANIQLINYLKTLKDLGHDTDVVVLDMNDLPVVIPNVEEFLTKTLDVYFQALNTYVTEFEKIKKSKRNVLSLIDGIDE